jgi:hypothetical protein
MVGSMKRGRVFTWVADSSRPSGGAARTEIVPLEIESSSDGILRLRGDHVIVRNGGEVYVPASDGSPEPVPVGDACPNADGDFLFEPHRGGGRVDKVVLADVDFRARYVEASHFGEVNVYYHLDRIASYTGSLLRQLGAPPLPPVTAVVNAHHAATVRDASGRRDGRHKSGRWLPFQGGHYRLPGKSIEVAELGALAASGEIHFGPGWSLLEHGWLVERSGTRYRANASHNPGIIYHEYGHHITRYTADFRGNSLRRADRQDNRKCALDEGTSDYWAASLLGTPHIWAFHKRHDDDVVHPRSLSSSKTMADYGEGPSADVHANGTIWAAALWDVRRELLRIERDGARRADLLVLAGLCRLGQIQADEGRGRIARLRRVRSGFAAAAAALVEADAWLYDGAHGALIRAVLRRRRIPIDGDYAAAAQAYRPAAHATLE